VLSAEAVEGFDLVALGHIHRPQQNGHVFYPGSPERLSFNDEGVKTGFWIHDIEPAGGVKSRFIETPSRRFVTLNLEEPEDEPGALEYVFSNPTDCLGHVKDAIVRLRYRAPEDVKKRLDRKAMERALYNAGAFHVAEIKADLDRRDRARDKEVTESLGVVEALRRWAEGQEIDEGEVSILQAMTQSLLEEVPT